MGNVVHGNFPQHVQEGTESVPSNDIEFLADDDDDISGDLDDYSLEDDD